MIASPADLGQLVVTGHDRVRGGDASVGERDSGDRGNGVRAGHPGNDADIDSGGPAGDDFLSPTSEDERVPALESDDPVAELGLSDEDVVDSALRHRMVSRQLPHVDDLRVEGCATIGFELIDDRPGAEAVGHDDIGAFQCAQTGDGEQSEIARSGTDEQHGAGLLWEEECHD